MIALALAAGFAVAYGCSFGFASLAPQSHFAFPNSNVIPLGHAEGSKSKLCGLLFINWGSPDGDDQEEATREALEQAHGDILINVRTEASTFMIPYLFAICSTKVQGTAAKMEVGRQQLTAFTSGAPPAAAPAPAAPPPAALATPVSMPPPGGGCTRDTDCKGDRICSAGACTAPR
jgi:hypothetical protein